MYLTRKQSEELCLSFVQSNAGNYTPRPISVQSGVWNQNSLFFISQKTVVDMQDGVSLYKCPEDSQWNLLWCYGNFSFFGILILTVALCCFCSVGPEKQLWDFFFPFVLAFRTERNPSFSHGKQNTVSFPNTFIWLSFSSVISSSLTISLVLILSRPQCSKDIDLISGSVVRHPLIKITNRYLLLNAHSCAHTKHILCIMMCWCCSHPPPFTYRIHYWKVYVMAPIVCVEIS